MIERFTKLDDLPTEPDSFSQWIKAEVHLDFLRSNASENELVIYASGEYTFIHTVAISNDRLTPLDQNDLLHWNLNPYTSVASLGGGGLIGLVAGLAFPTLSLWRAGLIGAIAGLAGSLFDSLLGATVQAMYYCPTCDKETERHPTHTCDTPTRHLRGWRWLNNDWVNFIASLIGGGAAILLGIAFRIR